MAKWIRRPTGLFIIFGLFLGLSIPVGAHSTEHNPSTDPITSMTVDMLNYQTKVALICDTPDPSGTRFDEVEGVELFLFDQMRIHANVDSARHGLDPTEHWGVRVVVSQAIEKRNGILRFDQFWDQEWAHQNASAHQKSHLVVRTNLYQLESRPGIWRVQITLEGEESGNTFEHVCIFETV